MEHTQPIQNHNSRSCALVRAKIHFFLLSGHGHGHGHVQSAGVCTAKAHKRKRTMQEPELPSD
jgi:hypothetical protein